MTSPARPTLLSLALVAAWPAWAQQQPQPSSPPARAPEAQELDRVVITADKRTGRQRDVAGTVSVVEGADLERRGAHDQEDTLKLTPGVQFNKGDTASNTITIRGIGTSTTNEGSGAQQGPTGSYLEDIPLVSPTGKGTVLDPLTWDLDRIEVLRGPQGVLFGSGSLGGALRYLYNKPVFGTVEASLKGEYAKTSDGDAKPSAYGMVNTPVGDQWALRVVGFDRRQPGYIDNLGTGTKDANDVRQRGGRALLSFRPVRELGATLVASTQKTTQGDTFSVSPDPGRLEHTAPNNSTRESKTDFYSLTVDWDLGATTLTSITGHWKSSSRALIDDTELFSSVGLTLPQVYRPQTGTSSATSQELRLASNTGGRMSYVVGLFWQHVKSDGTGQQIDPSAAFGIKNLVDLQSRGTGTEQAAFADTEYNFGGGWSAGIGARYYRTKVESSQTGTTFGAPSDFGPASTDDSGITPKVTAKYRFGQDNLWYAVASKGYRYGGLNQDGTSFKSDSLWSYETGVHLTPLAGLRVDLAAYLLDWRNAQFAYFYLSNGLPNSAIGNVGKARSTGFEAALRYRLNPAFEGVASLAWIDAQTKADVLIPSGGPTSLTAASGSRLPGTPRLQTALQGNLSFAGPFETSGRANLTYTHVGSRVMFLGGNKPADAYDTVDVGVSLARGAWTFAFGVANLGNEKGVLSITGAPAGVGAFAQYFLQRPRTYTASLRYDYF